MSTAEIVNKLWNYAHVLHDDGVGCGDYVEAAPALPAPAAFEHPCSSQTTYLAFLKMADEREKAGQQVQVPSKYA
jgi:type I restriction enzyme M protein